VAEDNGVSRLHGQVSRQLFAPLFPGRPIDEVPIGHVTNGVHMPTWDSAEADELWTTACGKGRWLGGTDKLTPYFSANRTVCEYTEEHYLPAAAAYRQRAADKGGVGQNIVNWRHTLESNWSHLGFGPMKVEIHGDQQVMEVDVRLFRLFGNPAEQA